MNRGLRVALSTGLFGSLALAAFSLSNSGTYGWTLFILLPLIAGALGTWTFRPATAVRALSIGAAIGGAGCCLFLVMGFEGFVCVLMAVPVLVPVSMLGSLIAYACRPWSTCQPPAMFALLLPVSMFFDVYAIPATYSVTTTAIVNATPERVWRNVPAFPDITAAPDWMLRTGVAYPIRSRIEGSGVGATRQCDLSTGTIEERVMVWDEPHQLKFVVTATPSAMKEKGLYGPIFPKHLNGYYIAKKGQFVLTSLPGGRTLVTGTSWYQHGLWPAEYWRWWSDAVVHHVHRRVLEHIRELSETGS